MKEHPASDELEHLAMNELIPWYLNGTIDEAARSRLDRHLPACPRCRADLDLDRAVHARIATQPAVEYIPAASLKRLNATLDARARPGATRHLQSRRLAVAAAIGILAVALGVVILDRMAGRGDPGTDAYHTVTTARARPPQETIRAVFAPAMTLVELQTVLDDARLKIVAGPTEAGVYSLAPTSTLATDSSLDILRRHTGVRFAESSQP